MMDILQPSITLKGAHIRRPWPWRPCCTTLGHNHGTRATPAVV